jgi:hypothetical protein
MSMIFGITRLRSDSLITSNRPGGVPAREDDITREGVRTRRAPSATVALIFGAMLGAVPGMGRSLSGESPDVRLACNRCRT